MPTFLRELRRFDNGPAPSDALCLRSRLTRREERRQAEELLRRLEAGFDPQAARGVDAVVEWRLVAGSSTREFQVAIRDGACVPLERFEPPRVTLSMGFEELEELLRGSELSPLFMARRLRVGGDVLLATRLRDFFGRARQ